ncbi:MAG TPA: hypothetical protein VLS90_21135, partial [Thermodesulfobacteriota bacterium]|nr:hypothetical protein [Thermodesulfobacteriota bacterium]
LLGRGRLKPGGVFCQWLQLYKLSPENLRSIIATFQQVFPSILVFEVEKYDLIILGSLEPLLPDRERVKSRFSDSGVRADLARVNIADADGLLDRFVLGSDEAREFSRGARLNTDDNALLEFSSPKSLYRETSEKNYGELVKFSRRIPAAPAR